LNNLRSELAALPRQLLLAVPPVEGGPVRFNWVGLYLHSLTDSLYLQTVATRLR